MLIVDRLYGIWSARSAWDQPRCSRAALHLIGEQRQRRGVALTYR